MKSDELKRNITMREIVEKYGFQPNRAGFIPCPFHKEKTASMKIYKDSYHCFGCGTNGDIFTFVQGMEHCDFKTAFKSLGGTYEDCSDYQHKMYQYRMKKRKETENKRLQKRTEDKWQVIEEIRLQKVFAKMFPVFSDDWCSTMNRLEYLFYKLSVLTEKR